MERQRTGADTEAAGTPPEPERFVTFGQRFQKWSTYISVDWVLNYITGMLFSVWGRYTDLGRTYWSGPLRKAATYVCKDVLKIGEAGPAQERPATPSVSSASSPAACSPFRR
ncbi:MAG: hypothetical protein WDN72_03615 [Alphaproteobacteria bacterium]